MSKPLIVTKAILAEDLAEKHDLSKKKASEIISSLLESIREHVNNGETVRLNDFGSFQQKERKARIGRNPQTGETIQIPAQMVVAFSRAKNF